MAEVNLDIVRSELATFRKNSEELIGKGLAKSLGVEWGVQLPARNADHLEVTILGIVHGNEVAGLRALNEVLQMAPLLNAYEYLSVNLILGNVPAALVGKRFLESDLNRSFNRKTVETAEHRRARELEPILARSSFLLDLHQTRELSANPFFIFPHSRTGVAFAAAISESTPIVTHWGEAFSKDGQCTDEFVNEHGGCGITLELGQNGFNDFSVGAGVRSILRALQAIEGRRVSGGFPQQRPPNPFYTWLKVVDYPAEGEAQMRTGLANFSYVTKGEVIGTVNGTELLAPDNSWLLFPYFAKPEDTRRPSELCRFMRKLSWDELPG